MTYINRTVEDQRHDLREAEVQEIAKINRTAKHLREIADKVEECSDASSVLHAITWGIANLNLDDLARFSAERAGHRAAVAAMEKGEQS